jgi:hypothetical protein
MEQGRMEAVTSCSLLRDPVTISLANLARLFSNPENRQHCETKAATEGGLCIQKSYARSDCKAAAQTTGSDFRDSMQERSSPDPAFAGGGQPCTTAISGAHKKPQLECFFSSTTCPSRGHHRRLPLGNEPGSNATAEHGSTSGPV